LPSNGVNQHSINIMGGRKGKGKKEKRAYPSIYTSCVA
jgi:hypothetical protein